MSKQRQSVALADYEWELLWAAMRYFMPRETIAASMFPALLIDHYHARLTHAQKESLVQDLRDHLARDGRFGHERIDQPGWSKLLDALDEENHADIRLTDGTHRRVFTANGRLYPLDEYLARPHREVFIPGENIAA